MVWFRTLSSSLSIPFDILRVVLLPIPAVLSMILISSCSAMSESECSTVQWELKGEKDGLEGLPIERFDIYKEDCAKHSIVFSDTELADYKVGLDRGYGQFCRRSNGYIQGFLGKPNYDVCPTSTRGTFNGSFLDGRTLRIAHDNVQRNVQQIRSKEQMIRDLRNDIRDASDTAYAEDSSESQRRQSESKITRLQNEIDELLAEIQPLYAQKSDRQYECRELAAEHLRQGYPKVKVCN